MIEYGVRDWDNAYANGPNIAGGERWPEAWIAPATSFRDALHGAGRAKLNVSYGERPRNVLDIFLPQNAPRGLVTFVHGGFWMRLDKSYWSHLAAGAVEQGYAVAMPSYTLCPESRVRDITNEVALAVAKAATLFTGPIHLVGHSAGGHLVTRMITTTSPLPIEVLHRVQKVVSISGVHDLRPLMNTAMNATLSIDAAEANTESPALLTPVAKARLCCWVGGAEREEFLRQNALLANIWQGLGASTAAVVEPDKHHFNIIDGLMDPAHPLTRALLSI
ncbi:alpha/beta hydrolase [Pararhizobium sp. YC-54]|uniref:alpha/beta hydrolase n=1 Tax=Pararhizobium sp. YC-54 TaxID=2986920 RepID=UPI0021F7894C|nr:alpha/beta hydrolase [Pararhizobium sp. YC-54]MCV9999280.1 alpha/beta hydrolase [Pararhizobium sp. YC-54]